MTYTENQIFDIFSKEILGKDRIDIEGFMFNCSYGFSKRELNEYVYVKDDAPVMQIKNVNRFKRTLFEYITTFLNSEKLFTKPEDFIDPVFASTKNKIMFALTNLFQNAGFEDFENIDLFVRRRIDFLTSDISTKNEAWKKIGGFFGLKNAELFFRIGENNYSRETPDRLEVKVERTNDKGEIERIYLPAISFGISGDTAYVFTCQKIKTQEDPNKQLQKEANRARYKVNENVDAEDQDVEPFAIISTIILSSFLKAEGVEKIYVNNFLPIRYFAKKEAYQRMAGDDFVKQKELEDKLQMIQDNLTYKFLKVFFRIAEQTGQIQLFSNIEPGFTIFQIENKASEIEGCSEILLNIFRKVLEACETQADGCK